VETFGIGITLKVVQRQGSGVTKRSVYGDPGVCMPPPEEVVAALQPRIRFEVGSQVVGTPHIPPKVACELQNRQVLTERTVAFK
jgi:hypothetical protein